MNAPMITSLSQSQPSPIAAAAKDQCATQLYPHVRNLQRDLLLDCIDLRPQMRVLDVHSEDGPLCEELKRRDQHDSIETVCLLSETSKRLQPKVMGITDPLEMFYSVASSSVDAALSLAALRSSRAQMRTIEETYRVLKHGGQFAFCDVEAGSGFARWLEEFVLPQMPGAQQAQFFAPGNASAMMQRTGFQDVVEVSLNVPLVFPSHAAISEYFRALFDLHCSEVELQASIEAYLSIRPARTNSWQFLELSCPMVYCSGTK